AMRTSIHCSFRAAALLPGTCSSARFAPALLNNGSKVVKITGKSASPRCGQPARGQWLAADKGFDDGDVSLGFQLLQMHAQIAVGHPQGVAHFDKGQTVDGSQNGDNGQPATLVQDRIQLVKNALEGVHGQLGLKD